VAYLAPEPGPWFWEAKGGEGLEAGGWFGAQSLTASGRQPRAGGQCRDPGEHPAQGGGLPLVCDDGGL